MDKIDIQIEDINGEDTIYISSNEHEGDIVLYTTQGIDTGWATLTHKAQVDQLIQALTIVRERLKR